MPHLGASAMHIGKRSPPVWRTGKAVSAAFKRSLDVLSDQRPAVSAAMLEKTTSTLKQSRLLQGRLTAKLGLKLHSRTSSVGGRLAGFSQACDCVAFCRSRRGIVVPDACNNVRSSQGRPSHVLHANSRLLSLSFIATWLTELQLGGDG